jgi:hypothetical protein
LGDFERLLLPSSDGRMKMPGRAQRSSIGCDIFVGGNKYNRNNNMSTKRAIERTALLAKQSYEEEAMEHLQAQADADRACGGVGQHCQHKDPQHQNCSAEDVAWTCSSSAALIILVAIILLPLGLVAMHPMGDESVSVGRPIPIIPILGTSKNKKKKKHHDDGKKNECESDTKYSKRTVKTAYELPFAALFRNNRGQKKFEASSVTIVDNTVYAVCDSSFAISKFDSALLPFSSDNVQIGSPERDGDVESGYEAIFHHGGSFYVVRESVLHHEHESDDDEVSDGGNDGKNGLDENHSFRAIIEELVLADDDYTVQHRCSSEFEFEGASKGFEGAVGFPDATGELYILGLCEGNHCSESRKADAGNGRMVLMKKKVGDDVPGGCVWSTLRTIEIPSSANFIDYSAIDISDDGRVVITSQEDSSLWLGQVAGITNGVIDFAAFE